MCILRIMRFSDGSHETRTLIGHHEGGTLSNGRWGHKWSIKSIRGLHSLQKLPVDLPPLLKADDRLRKQVCCCPHALMCATAFCEGVLSSLFYKLQQVFLSPLDGGPAHDTQVRMWKESRGMTMLIQIPSLICMINVQELHLAGSADQVRGTNTKLWPAEPGNQSGEPQIMTPPWPAAHTKVQPIKIDGKTFVSDRDYLMIEIRLASAGILIRVRNRRRWNTTIFVSLSIP